MEVLKFVILLTVVTLIKGQLDPYEVCVGQETGTMIGVGQDISCTQYFDCENDFGYEEDCVEKFGEGYEFSYESNSCEPADVVQCADYVQPEDTSPETPEPEPETPAPPPATPNPQPTVTQSTTSGPLTPDAQCPTNRPGEIIFFESSNCTQYFICANGVRMTMNCMDGFVWNQDERQCDYPIFSKCGVSCHVTVFDHSVINFTFKLQQNIRDDGMNVSCTRQGFYTTAYPRDCTKFVFCSLGIPMVQNCPNGHAWSTDRCVMRQFASCPDTSRLRFL